MRKILLSVSSAIVLLLGVTPVFSAGEENVQVLVSTELISVSLDIDTINFGALPLNTESPSSVQIMARNNGTVVEDFGIKGTTASCNNCSSSNNWALSSTNDSTDKYIMKYSTDNWTTPITMTTNYVGFASNMSINGDSGFKFKLTTPQASTVMGNYDTNVWVLATKHI